MCLKKIMFIIRGKKHEMHLNNLTPHQWTKVSRLFFFFLQNGFLKMPYWEQKTPRSKHAQRGPRCHFLKCFTKNSPFD